MPAETLHTTHQGGYEEDAKVAKLERQLAAAQFDKEQKIAFGQRDITAPNEAEDTYQSYLDQRPSEGVIRDGEGYRNAQSGQFASGEAYEAQKGDTQSYYDQLGGIGNQEVYEAPNYEEMGVMQLAKEAAKAQQLGDVAEEATIREALEQHLTIDALKDDAESPEAAQERYESEVARYDDLVKKFSGQSDTVTSEEAAQKTDSELHTSEKETAEPDIFLSGEKVDIDNVFESPDGQKAVLVKNADGTTQLVLEKELTYATQEAASEPAEAEPLVDTTDAELEADDATVQLSTGKEIERFVGKELEPYDASRHELEKHEAEKEKTKKWWEKARDGFRKRAGVAYWAAQWETYAATPLREQWSKVLEFRVTDDMTEDEKEKRRKDNRIAATIAGAGIVALAAIGAGVAIAEGLAAIDTNRDLGTTPDLGKNAGGGGLETLKPDTGLDVGEGTQDALFSPEISSVTVNPGEGGEALFQRYGIPIDRWYDNAQTLLNQFPQDFYREGNDVRIAHTGPLSQGAQDFINTLK